MKITFCFSRLKKAFEQLFESQQETIAHFPTLGLLLGTKLYSGQHFNKSGLKHLKLNLEKNNGPETTSIRKLPNYFVY